MASITLAIVVIVIEVDTEVSINLQQFEASTSGAIKAAK